MTLLNTHGDGCACSVCNGAMPRCSYCGETLTQTFNGGTFCSLECEQEWNGKHVTCQRCGESDEHGLNEDGLCPGCASAKEDDPLEYVSDEEQKAQAKNAPEDTLEQDESGSACRLCGKDEDECPDGLNEDGECDDCGIEPEQALETVLLDLLEDGDANHYFEGEGLEGTRHTRSFEDSGLLTNNKGVLLTVGKRRFQITIVEDRR